ncbi:MAG TPA: SRPBCC domain-containing protein [Candidatus Acidoferrum sp.]|jgi:hypothetical protein
MTSQIKSVEDLMLNITQEVHVKASLEKTFESLLDQLGPYNERPDGVSLQMKIEPWPGGRWYRDLGDSNGHFWGNVQAIKRPTLLEITGPLFASSPFVSNLQYRLSAEPGGTLITFRHTALGVLTEDQRKGVGTGWSHMLSRIKSQAESASSRSAAVQ